MSTENAIEVKKDGLRQCQDGTWKLSLTVHPNDMLTSLMTAPMGTRYGMALVEIGDDERPVSPALNKVQDRPTTARKPAATRAEKARRLCGVAKFQGFIFNYWPGTLPDGVLAGTPYEVTDYCVKSWCLVKSKSEFDTNPEAAKRWDHLLSEYEQATGRMAEKH